MLHSHDLPLLLQGNTQRLLSRKAALSLNDFRINTNVFQQRKRYQTWMGGITWILTAESFI